MHSKSDLAGSRGQQTRQPNRPVTNLSLLHVVWFFCWQVACCCLTERETKDTKSSRLQNYLMGECCLTPRLSPRQCVLACLERDLEWWRRSSCRRQAPRSKRSPELDATLCRLRSQGGELKSRVLTNMVVVRSIDGNLSAAVLHDPGDPFGPSRHWPARAVAVLLQMASLRDRIMDGALPPLPSFVAVINPHDHPQQHARTDWCGLLPLLSNARVQGAQRDLLAPDFSFGADSYLTNTLSDLGVHASVPTGWPEARERTYRAGVAAGPFGARRRVLYWRGGRTHPQRAKYATALASDVGAALRTEAAVAPDVVLCGRHCSRTEGKPTHEWCAHQALLALPGASFAVGFKYALLCGSLVVRGAQAAASCKRCLKEYAQFWHAGLRENEHYVTSHRPSDLPRVLQRALPPPSTASRDASSSLQQPPPPPPPSRAAAQNGSGVASAAAIARRGAAYTYDVLEPAFILEYWHALLSGYARLHSPRSWGSHPLLSRGSPEAATTFDGNGQPPISADERRCALWHKSGGVARLHATPAVAASDFVPIPSLAALRAESRTPGGLVRVYRRFAHLLPPRFAGTNASAIAAARRELARWQGSS